MGQRQNLQSGDTTGEYYLALPASGTGRGVLVLHAWWGLTSVFTAVCDRLAEAGFVALAPDLYNGRTATTREQAEQLSSTLNDEATYALINRAIAELQTQPEGEGRPIGVVGFSLGGGWALSLNRGVGAVVIYYATVPLEYVAVTAPIMGHFAESDEFEPLDNVRQFEQALRAKELIVDFHIYPKTQHWFSESNQPGYYDPAAADLAWQRTIDFLQQHLPEGLARSP
jgi:carboxymethylenebutenolidase